MLLTTFESIWQFITILFIFIFVCVITYLTTRFVGGYQMGKKAASNIEVIETSKVTANKYIQIVKIGKTYFAIAVCKDTITMLTELKEEDLKIIEASNLPSLSFKEIFEKAKNLKNKK